MQFEGVDLSDMDLTELVINQLATGTHRAFADSSSGEWLVRAWQSLPPNGRTHLSAAVHQALQNDSPDIRVEALRTLDMCPQMADADTLLQLAQTRFDLFRGLRSRSDGMDVDRGRDFVQLTAHVATGSQGQAFRRQMALDPTYGMNVLASLVDEDVDWVLAHADELFNTTIDPDGVRLNIVFFNLRQNPPQLAQLVKQLAQAQPALHGRLRATIQSTIRDAPLQRQLLDLVKSNV